MAPAERLGHGSGRAAGLVEPAVAGIGVGLQYPGEGTEVLDRVIARTIPRIPKPQPLREGTVPQAGQIRRMILSDPRGPIQ